MSARSEKSAQRVTIKRAVRDTSTRHESSMRGTKVRGAQNIREEQVRAQGATQRTMIETQLQRSRQEREMSP